MSDPITVQQETQENKAVSKAEPKESLSTLMSAPDVVLASNIFMSMHGFALATKMAQVLSNSTIVPASYRGNMGNCLIALEMANRLGTSPLMVMQNLYIVNGTPAWSSQFIIAMINNSKKYKTELLFDMQGKGESLSCYAYVEDKNGHKVVGPLIDMAMANAEGWVSKNGSKWKTMPEVMIRYRAASFFGRLNCPEMIMGIYTLEEVQEGIAPTNQAPAFMPVIEDENKIPLTFQDDGEQQEGNTSGDVTAETAQPSQTQEEQTRDDISQLEIPLGTQGSTQASKPLRGPNF
jgi:hypothetical protein